MEVAFNFQEDSDFRWYLISIAWMEHGGVIRFGCLMLHRVLEGVLGIISTDTFSEFNDFLCVNS